MTIKTSLPKSSPNDEISITLSVVREVCINYLHEKEDNFRGFSPSEIDELETKTGQRFPLAYRLFMEQFAAGQLKIFDCQSYTKTGVIDALEVAQELLEQDKTTLPENAVPFSQWQGYQFYYFINSGIDNPETFLYIEGGNETPPEIHNCGSFTDWLIDLSVNNIELYGRLQRVNTDKAIERLSELRN